MIHENINAIKEYVSAMFILIRSYSYNKNLQTCVKIDISVDVIH